MFDLVVVGLGPAGRALASHAATRGLSVCAIDPRDPEAPWAPTYGLWADQLGDLPASVVRSRVDRPVLRAHGEHRIERSYVVLDNVAVQAALPLTGVVVRRAKVDDTDLAALRHTARVVVDARGARPQGRVVNDPAPAQTAFGVVVDAATAEPVLAGPDGMVASGVLMDWRTDWAVDPEHPTGTPSFLYAIPLGDSQGGDDRFLLEETCLAAAPAMPIDELSTRLVRRLRRRGVAAAALESPLGREVVRIPMRGRDRRPARGVLAVGTAGRGGHLVSGYSVAHSLTTGRRLAEELAAGQPPAVVDRLSPADVLREAGLRSLLHLDVTGTLDLFDAFGRLPAVDQAAFLSRDSSLTSLASAMWKMFRVMPSAGQRALAAATLLPH